MPGTLITIERIPARAACCQTAGSRIVITLVNVISQVCGLRSTNPKTPWRPGLVPVEADAHDTDEIGGSGAHDDNSSPCSASAARLGNAPSANRRRR